MLSNIYSLIIYICQFEINDVCENIFSFLVLLEQLCHLRVTLLPSISKVCLPKFGHGLIPNRALIYRMNESFYKNEANIFTWTSIYSKI